MWKGSFLCYTYSTPSQFDEAACLLVEQSGLDPCVKPGSRLYKQLAEQLQQLHEALMFPRHKLKGKGAKRLFLWTPPRTGNPADDEKLAEILNLMLPNHHAKAITPENARAVLTVVNEKGFGVDADKTGNAAIDCDCPISSMYAALQQCDMLVQGAVEEGVHAVLNEWASMKADQFKREFF